MKALLPILFYACAPLDGVPDSIRLSEGAERAGTALRMPDGRLVAVRVLKMQRVGNLPCGHFEEPDRIWLIDDPQHCPSLEMLVQHELGHAAGREHEERGIMNAACDDFALSLRLAEQGGPR